MYRLELSIKVGKLRRFRQDDGTEREDVRRRIIVDSRLVARLSTE